MQSRYWLNTVEVEEKLVSIPSSSLQKDEKFDKIISFLSGNGAALDLTGGFMPVHGLSACWTFSHQIVSDIGLRL
jgi:hypothetical protein